MKFRWYVPDFKPDAFLLLNATDYLEQASGLRVAVTIQHIFQDSGSKSGKLRKPMIANTPFYAVPKRGFSNPDFAPQEAFSSSGQERIPVIRVSKGPVKHRILNVFAQWHTYSPLLIPCKYSFHNL